MINRQNYSEKIKEVKVSDFPSDLKELYDFFNEATENGTNWTAYDEGDVKFVIDAYFERLNFFVRSNSAPAIEKPEKSEKRIRKIQTEKPVRSHIKVHKEK